MLANDYHFKMHLLYKVERLDNKPWGQVRVIWWQFTIKMNANNY